MKRVLIVSPHFPPDSSAGTHRARLLAPHLPEHGWEATVVTVDARDYDSRLDPDLEALVPKSVRVVRCRALPTRWTRRVGVGDLGLRALGGLWGACKKVLSWRRHDALLVTIYPTYPALLGPVLKRRYGLPLVLDYQDPWVGAWGATVGARPDGKPTLKDRLSRQLARTLEPLALRAVDGLTAVSKETIAPLRARHPSLAHRPAAAIPIGAEARDFEHQRRNPRANRWFDPGDGRLHLCCVGTLLPRGFETLRAVLGALRMLRDEDPDEYKKVHLHFFGSSNQTASDAPQRVLPVARELGVADRVTEVAPRIDYLDALAVQTQASAILLMGSTERHYTASRLYPALLARRPVLAVYHGVSSVVEILGRATSAPTVRCVTYDDERRAEARVAEIYTALRDLVRRPHYDSADVSFEELEPYSARATAGRFAELLDAVVQRRGAS